MSAALDHPGLSTSTTMTVEMISARMDRLPSSKTLWRFVMLIALGGFFEAYELFSTSFVIPGMIRSGILQATTEGMFALNGAAAYIGATFTGLFIGTMGFGLLADRFGRRVVFTYALIGYSICSLIMAFQVDALWLNFWRLITAIGLGVELVAIDAFLTELMPPKLRGRAFALNRLLAFLAIPVCGLVSWALVPHEPFGIDGWRWVIAIGALGSLLVWVLRRALPESARWLASAGRLREADEEVGRLERKIESEIGCALPQPIVSKLSAAVSQKGHFSEMWSLQYRSRFAMLVIFHVLLSIGVYGFMNWAPTFLIEQGVTVSKSLAYTVVMGCCAPLGPLLAMTFADHVERKWQIVIASLLMAVAGVAFAQFRVPILVIACGGLITICSTMISVSYHAYQSELFPTRIRAMAIGTVYSASRIGGGLSGFLIAFAMGHFGLSAALGVIAGSMVIIALIIALLGPLTRGRTLEEIND